MLSKRSASIALISGKEDVYKRQLQKLDEITDEDFAELELVPDFDTDE